MAVREEGLFRGGSGHVHGERELGLVVRWRRRGGQADGGGGRGDAEGLVGFVEGRAVGGDLQRRGTLRHGGGGACGQHRDNEGSNGVEVEKGPVVFFKGTGPRGRRMEKDWIGPGTWLQADQSHLTTRVVKTQWDF